MAKEKLTPEQQTELETIVPLMSASLGEIEKIDAIIAEKLKTSGLDKDLEIREELVKNHLAKFGNQMDRAKDLDCGTIHSPGKNIVQKTTITHVYDEEKILKDHPEVASWRDCWGIKITNVGKRGIAIEQYRTETARYSHSVEPKDSALKQTLGWLKQILNEQKLAGKSFSDVSKIEADLKEAGDLLYN